MKTDTLPIPTYITADDKPEEIVQRLDRARELILALGASASVLDAFIAQIEDEEPGKSEHWSLAVENDKLLGIFSQGLLKLVITTNDREVPDLVRKYAPVVLSMDVNWRTEPHRGLEITESLLGDSEIQEKMVIMLKTTVENEAAADFLRRKRSVLPLRNPFVRDTGRFNLQVVETTHDSRRGQSKRSLEIERLRYALMALTESVFFQRSFTCASYREFRQALDRFDNDAGFFGCFRGAAKKSYRKQLQLNYGFNKGFPVPTLDDSDSATLNGIDTTLAYSVLGDSRISGLGKKLVKLGSDKIKESLSITRLLLRHDRIHQVEILLRVLPMNKQGQLRPISKNDLRQKLKRDKFDNFGDESAFISLPKLESFVKRLEKTVEDLPPDELLNEKIGKLLGLLSQEAGKDHFDIGDYERALLDLRAYVSQSLTLVEADFLFGEIDRLEGQIAPRNGLLIFERSYHPSPLKNVQLPEKTLSLLRWQQILHPAAYARKLMSIEDNLGQVAVDKLIQVLSIDCECVEATRAVQQLKPEDFEQWCEIAEGTRLRMGLPISSESKSEEDLLRLSRESEDELKRGELTPAEAAAYAQGELTLPLLHQFAWSVFFQEWRIRQFCEALNLNDGAKEDDLLSHSQKQTITQILSRLWIERGWAELYFVQSDPEWKYNPLSEAWTSQSCLAERLREVVPDLWKAFNRLLQKVEGSKPPMWLVLGWTPPADLDWMESVNLIRRDPASSGRIKAVSHTGARGEAGQESGEDELEVKDDDKDDERDVTGSALDAPASEAFSALDDPVFQEMAEFLIEQPDNVIRELLQPVSPEKPDVVEQIVKQFEKYSGNPETIPEAITLLKGIETRDPDLTNRFMRQINRVFQECAEFLIEQPLDDISEIFQAVLPKNAELAEQIVGRFNAYSGDFERIPDAVSLLKGIEKRVPGFKNYLSRHIRCHF